MDPRQCRNCKRPIPEDKRRGTRFCGSPQCDSDRATKRQRARRAQPQVHAPKVLEPGDPGTAEWCAFHGFTPTDLARHNVRRYSKADADAIVELFRDVRPNKKGKAPNAASIRRVVKQSEGLLMPKFPLPGREPIPTQLDPDDEVVTDPRVRWEKHDRVLPEGRKVLARVKRNDKFALIPNHWVKKIRNGKGELRRERVSGYEYSIELAHAHIGRARDKPYDASTGEGDHRGVNVQGWHRRAPRKAKYVNWGDNQRLDVGPDGLEPWQSAPLGLLILEGKKKHLAAEAHGWPTASMLSITMWNLWEIVRLSGWISKNNPALTVFVVPDGDWRNFERNGGAVFRQAMYVLTAFWDLWDVGGVAAGILTTPIPPETLECECDVKDLIRRGLPFDRISDVMTCRYCGGYLKALDDWYGAGGASTDLVVIDRKPPKDRIAGYTLSLPIHGHAKPGRARALLGLSLHDRDDYSLLDVPLKTLQAKIMRARRPQDVPEILEDLHGAVDVDGSLDMQKRPFRREDGTPGVAWDWKERPQIRVRDEFRATEKTTTLGDFGRAHQVTIEQYNELKSRVEDLERRADDRDQREVADVIDGCERLLAEVPDSAR